MVARVFDGERGGRRAERARAIEHHGELVRARGADARFVRAGMGAVGDSCRMVRDAGYRLVNVDATVFLEQVRLSLHKQAIARNLARLMAPFWELSDGGINVKAKTMEGCDAIGRGEAVGAQVAVLVAREAD